MEQKTQISYETFANLELRVGKVLEAHDVPDSKKLVRLILDDGTAKRQIIAGIRKSYAPAELIGKQILFIANLEPKLLVGLESHGMILVVHVADGYVLMLPEKQVESGSLVA